MKKFILCAIACYAFVQCGFAQQKTVTIKGTITGDLKGHNNIYMYTRMGTDSTEIVNGHYTFSFPYEKTEFKALLPGYVTAMHMMYQPFGILIAQPGTYYVQSDITKGMQQSSTVKGPESAVLYRNFEIEQTQAYFKLSKASAALYGDDWYKIDEKDARYESYKKSNDSLQQIYLVPIIEKLVKQHPNSPASAFVLAGSGKGLSSMKTQEELYSMLSSKMQHSKEGTYFYDYIQGIKNSAIGKTVNNFELPNPEDNAISLNHFKGKYLLIDFWASWCAPCRQSFPHMRQLYQQYKGKNFEILSISIDQNNKAWLKAVKEEKNPWPQVLDTKNISQKGFAISGVPSTFLISPDGKILAKQVGFDPEGKENPIEDKMAELLGAPASTVSKTIKTPDTKKKVIKAVRMSGM